MASVGVAGAAAAFSWNPFLAAGAIALASYLDQQYLYPALLEDDKAKAKPRGLVGLPQTTTTPGTPRVWAIGRRVRVPAHVFYQSQKEREDTISGPKGGVAGVVRRVFADVGLHVNDRLTNKLTQLAANGQLIYWDDKNLVRITTSEITASIVTTTVTTGTTAAGSTTTSVNATTPAATAGSYRQLRFTSGTNVGKARPIKTSAASNYTFNRAFPVAPTAGDTFSIVRLQLKLTMNTNYEPDFTDYLVVGDVVDLRGFSADYATGLNNHTPWQTKSWWRVNAITQHGATPSSITLDPIMEQDFGPVTSVTAGNAFLPASIVREDQVVLLTEPEETIVDPPPGAVFSTPIQAGSLSQEHINERFLRFFGTNGRVNVYAYNLTVNGVDTGQQSHRLRYAYDLNPPYPYLYQNPVGGGGSIISTINGRAAVITRQVALGYETGMFYDDPAGWFYQGNDAQEENGIILKTETSGQVPGFRGMCYQMLQQWDLSTYFGNQVPPIVEAIIEPDSVMILPQALLRICERAQSPDLKFDTVGVNNTPFEGYWTQGAIPTVTALQPVMTAFQVAAQERNDTLVFFNIENADVVQIENGLAFSDLGVTSGAGTPFAGDKVKITQRDIADLPTSIGVTHQDPDQQYSQGFQHFKQRQPSPLPSANEQNVNLDNIVLSRKQARNLAGTIMRRAWVNAMALEFQLPVAYLELLENDLVTLTTDDGQDFTARIIRREVGNNFVVNVYAVVEDVSLAVRGSPVQGPSNIVIGTLDTQSPEARVVDVPPLADEDAFVPGYYVGASSESWQGATVYESRDGGNNWSQVATLNTQCGMGLTTTSLASGTPGDGIGAVAYDTVNSFTVAVDNIGPLGFMVTTTTAQVEAGVNWMLVKNGTNWEILGARDVTDNGDGTYTFSHLLRGLRGTYDSAATTKAAGSKVTFLYLARQYEALKLVPINLSASSLPVTLQVKVVGTGQALIDVAAETVTVNAWNARPMPGKMFSTELDVGTYDRIFVFDYWTRKQTLVGSAGPFQLDESFEGYLVRIYDPTGATLVRTKTISSLGTGSNRIRVDRSCPYLAAEQTADGYTPGPTTTFKVQRVQLGDFGEGRTWMEDV